MNKKICQRLHAKKRLQERFDIQINRHELRELVTQIQTGKAYNLETQSHRISIKEVNYKNKNFAVVYDNQRKTIVTFLRDEALMNYKNNHLS